ncbi:MAG TPA: hypothetical protein VFH51_06270, partial [Myxococcota bacterium]|nr:hypothetical protein [Myxococcota bacterium]
MTSVPLGAPLRAIIEEEEALLARVQEALQRARGGRSGAEGEQALANVRTLREEAMETSHEDLP